MSGFDAFASTLRVRKYNRTTIVLNGTFTSKVILNNSFYVSTSLFHSPLGNQQFNHYPMKLPAQHLCDFVNSLYDDYGEFLTNIYNMPPRGTCPIQPQDVHTIDKVFPTRSVPPYLPKGLWKIFITIALWEAEITKFEKWRCIAYLILVGGRNQKVNRTVQYSRRPVNLAHAKITPQKILPLRLLETIEDGSHWKRLCAA
uniref:Uncharacterized protein n=1 Tax=Anopheles farauti TaxID=69004 RepID=A0A182QL79_9DIPT